MDAAIFTSHMGRTLIRCVEPKERDNIEIGAGGSVGAGGMAMSETPDAEPISKFIRPLSELVIPEPVFPGRVLVSKVIAPPEVSVTATETLTCEFK